MISLYALHGFLGTPSDWEFFTPSVILKTIHLCCPAEDSFTGWAKQFNRLASSDHHFKILLGYSLGGRLAMHALIEGSGTWDAAIIVSANPGLQCKELKKQRVEQDKEWAKRFEQEPWDELMTRWNFRECFKSSFSFVRKEEDYQRLELASQLQNWSLGAQEDLRPELAKLKIPIFWIAGKNDSVYATLAEELFVSIPNSKIWIAPNAGHRVPWDVPEAFFDQVAQFIGTLKGEV